LVYSNQQPTLTLTEGYTYKFDTSDSTNATHHFKFSTTADGTFGSGVDYTTGVTYNGTPGSTGAYTQIAVAASAPTLYYWCHYHASMGGQADTPAEFLPLGQGAMRYKIETKNQSYTLATAADHSVTSLLQFNFEDNITPVASNGTVTSNGSYTYTTGKFSKGIVFGTSGAGRNVQGMTITGLPAAAKTICMWIKVTDNTGNDYILDGRSAGGDSSPYSWRNPNNIHSGDYINGSVLSSDTALIVNAWTHVAFCINESNMTGVTIGSRYAQESSNWAAEDIIIDKLEIFNSILSASDVSTIYNSQVAAGAVATYTGKITRVHGTSFAWS
jgi:hypothetical protein